MAERSCTKVKYASRAKANKARRHDLAGTRYAAAKYAYLCPYCGSFHLTRQPQRNEARGA